MRSLKKFTLILLAAIVFLCSVNGIKAVAVGDSIKFNWISGNVNSKSGAGIRAGGYYYEMYNYYGSLNNGKEVKLYCVDPQRLNNSRGSSVKISEVFNLSNNKISLNTRALYYGFYNILTSGATSRYASNSDLLATDLAVRAYFFTAFGSKATTIQKNSNRKSQALRNFGVSIVNSDQTLKNSDLFGTSKWGNATMSFPTSTAANIKSKATSLLKAGYAAAVKFKEDKGLAAGLVVNNITTRNENEDVNNRFRQEKIVRFHIERKQENSGFLKINRNDIVCNRCAEYGISIEKVEYSNNGNWVALGNTDVDISKFVDNTGSVELKITINKQEITSDDCNVSITINYDLPAPTNLEVFFVNFGQESRQRYVGVRNVGTASDGSLTESYTIPANDIGCVTKPCNSNLEEPVCSEEGKPATITAPTDIKRCIVNASKTDDAGNTYKVSDALNGNKYCATYCKEDYAKIELNRAITGLKCGGYFTLKASIEGSQDCYRAGNGSDRSINKTQFLSDMVEIQTNLVSGYDEYLKAKTAKDNISAAKVVDANEQYLEIIENNSDENSSNQEQNQENDKQQMYVLEGKYTGVEVDKMDNSKGYIHIVNNEDDREYAFAGFTLEELTKQIDDALDEASKTLDNYYEQYTNAVSLFNDCTKNLSKDFKFAQQIYWEYNEYFSNNGYQQTKPSTTLSDLLDKEERKMIADGEGTKNSKLYVCTGDVDNEYKNCTTGWIEVTDNYDINSLASDYNFTICTKDGCKETTEKLSSVRYVVQHSEASQNYVSKNSFYQVAGSGPLSGAITGDFDIDGVQKNNIPGIPLSIDSVGGGIFKLQIEDLGEFYNSGATGRLIDKGGEHEKESVANVVKPEIKWNGEYVCYYKNNCKPKDCPDCDFECTLPNGGECVWKECPDCDFECVNCIFNLGQLQLNNKTISPNNFGSADREYGYNWNVNKTLEKLELIRDKAEATIEEIEEANTTIYDTGNDEALEFEIVMTPEVTNYIRDYNKRVEEAQEGGYGNDSLTCYDYEDQNGVVHQNLFCYSDFIDELATKANADITAKNRGSIEDRVDSEGKLKDYSYWMPWTKTTTKDYDNDVIGGPAWK